jgi:hypothetical protein
VVPCSVAAGYQYFGGPHCLDLHPEDEGSEVLQNAGIPPAALTPREELLVPPLARRLCGLQSQSAHSSKKKSYPCQMSVIIKTIFIKQ